MVDHMPILVPMGDPADQRALAYATRLPFAAAAGVTVLSVVPDAAAVPAKRAAFEKALVDIVDVPIGVDVVVHDSVEGAIVAGAESTSLVLMTTAATLLPHEGHLGSIAESVVRSVTQPVILVGPKVDGPMSIPATRLVVPLDGSGAAEAVLESAAELAALLGAQVWVVTVVSEAQVRRAEDATGPEYGAIEPAYVRRMAKRVGGEAQYEVLHGDDPAAAILDFAHPDGIVAMSTHGRAGLSRLIAGSVTHDVVAGSHQPVLVMRPPPHIMAE